MRKVCILGTTPSGVKAPYDDPSWEIWGVGGRNNYTTRADRWFEIHALKTKTQDWIDDWVARVKEASSDCELWVAEDAPISTENIIPMERIKKRFGTYFLTSTIAWMMALAIDEGVDEMMLWGIDLEYAGEYRDQRAGVKHFIGLAEFAGIKMHVDGVNGIAFDPVPYPDHLYDPQILKINWRIDLQKKDLEDLTAKKEAVEKEISSIQAVAEWVSGTMTVTPEELRIRLEELYAQLPKLSMDVAGMDGQLRATQWQRDQLKP